MTDLEITKLCADAMGQLVFEVSQNRPEHTLRIINDRGIRTSVNYWPLKDDAQAMALVKRFNLRLDKDRSLVEKWAVYSKRDYSDAMFNADLNRAICECVANMQKGK